MIDRQQVARFAAPAAFLLAVTILVLLVRSATSEDEPATAPPAATTPVAATTAAAATPPPADTTPATTPASSTYTIEAGDTLQTIADQYGTTVEELLVLNPGVDPTALQVGQTIRVP